jgi:nucleotide-binding universal stress UspA family protein
MPDHPRPVVVGVDGSRPADAALDWAVAEARSRRVPLRIVHAFVWPLFKVRLGPSPYGPPEGGLRAQAEHVLTEAAERAREAASDLEVEARLRTGLPAAVLLAEGADAELIVLGCRGLGGFAGLLVGSVSGQVAEHATRPVVVLRPPGPQPGEPATRDRVVVGVDRSPESDEAIRLAFQEASRLGCGLTGVHCVPAAPGDPPGGDDLARGGRPEDPEGRRLAETLAGRSGKFPDVDVRFLVVRGSPARELVRLSPGARLLVVGRRGGGGFRGLLLGSTSRAALHHAACPVAVVPYRRETDGREPDGRET